MESRVGSFHIARGCMILLLWMPLMQFCVRGCFTVVTRDKNGKEDWMLKDTRVKARMCTALYGILVPGMLFSMPFTLPYGPYYSPIDTPLIAFTIASFIVNLCVCVHVVKEKSRDIIAPEMQALSRAGYILPIASVIIALIYCKITGTQI